MAGVVLGGRRGTEARELRIKNAGVMCTLARPCVETNLCANHNTGTALCSCFSSLPYPFATTPLVHVRFGKHHKVSAFIRLCKIERTNYPIKTTY